MSWTQVSRNRSLAIRQARRIDRRAAYGLPPESIGRGKPRRGAHGELIPRHATPMYLATLEVRNDLERGYHSPARYMTRTAYKLRKHEMAVYRTMWSAIAQTIRDSPTDTLCVP